MPNFSIKQTQSKLFLSWESTYQLLQDVKQPHTRQRAFNLLLQAHADDIAAMCRSTVWATQWGFEDAYQEAVTHFFETALRTDDPAELKSYWNLRNAVRVGAARNIYPISVSPHLAQQLRAHSFSREIDLVSAPRSKPDSFDEIGWHFLLDFCQRFLTKRQQSILQFLCQTPGDIPTVLELADFLNLSKASAQRAWNYFQNVFKKNIEIIQNLHHSIGLDFLKAYFQTSLNLPVHAALEMKVSETIKRQTKSVWGSNSALSMVSRLMIQLLQPLANPDTFITWEKFTHSSDGFTQIYCQLFRDQFNCQFLDSDNTNDLAFLSNGTKIHFSPVQFGNLLQLESTKQGLSAYSLFGMTLIAKNSIWLYLLADFFSFLDWISRCFGAFTDLCWQISPWSIASFRPVRGSPVL